MKLSDISIARPVFATMMILTLVVLGLFSFNKLNIDQFPDVDLPYVTATTVLVGAGPEQIETDVTKRIEDAVNTIGGIEHITSTSQEGVSIVVMQFQLEISGQQAAQEVREKIAGIRSTLPTDIEEPVIQRIDPASLPIFKLTVSGTRSEKEITTYTRDVIKKRLENVSGVGRVDLVGGAEREIQIEADATKLQAYNLSIQDVIQAVASSNMEVPAGNLYHGKNQILLRTMGKFVNVEDFNQIIVSVSNGRLVHLSDVATVTDGAKDQTSLTRLNGNAAVGLSIIRQSGANTVRVADALRKQVAVVQKELPSDLTLTVAKDNSITIRDSVNDVLFNILYGGILAVVVVFLFLANIRPTLISAIALPTSIIASFLIMYMLHFTLNMMTLLALSLAVGLLIDDAIVVIENIYRHMQQGEGPSEAARHATSEIGLAVMATTFTVVAVFVPVAFIPGIVGRFFYQFGITVSAAVVVSLFVAFTLTPMLASRWLRKEDEELSPRGNPLRKGLYYFNHFFSVISNRYQKAVAWCLQHRRTVVAGTIFVFVSSIFFMRFLGTAFFPSSDLGELYIVVEAAPGSSLEQTSAICSQIELMMRERPDVISTLTTIGAGNDPVTLGEVFVKTVKKTERKQTIEEIAADARSRLLNIPGATIGYQTSSGPGGHGKAVSLSVRGHDISTLKKLSDQVEQIVRNTPGAVDVTNSMEASKPEWRIRIDRDRASDLGVGVASIASTARSMVDGSVATTYQEGDDRYDVRVRLQKSDRTSLDNISTLMVKGTKKDSDSRDMLVPLQNVASIEAASGPTKINRYDRQRAITVESNLSGRVMGDVLKDAMKEIKLLKVPSGYSIGVTGLGEMQSKAFADMMMALLLAIVFVYIVLAAQFESFRHPFAIMLALPMSLIGAVFALLAFHSSLSVISIIGIIMLMGLVTKNGILLVDFANVLRRRGLEMNEALVKAGATRLRPILMTTFAMIFGMIPVAFSLGEGSEMRSPMGQAVIGGLLTSTLLTLFLVPVAYAIISDFSFRKLFHRRKRT